MKSKSCIWITTLVCVITLLLNSPSALAQSTQSNQSSGLANAIQHVEDNGVDPYSLAVLTAIYNLNIIQAMIGIWTILGILVLVLGAVAIYYLYDTAKKKLYPAPSTNSVPSITMAFIQSDTQQPLLRGNSLDIEPSSSELADGSEWPFGVEVVIDRSGSVPVVKLTGHKFTEGELKTEEEIKSIIFSYGLNPPQGVNYLVNGEQVDVGDSLIYKAGNTVVVQNPASSVTNNFTLEVSFDMQSWIPVIDISSQYMTNRIYGVESSNKMFFRAVLH